MGVHHRVSNKASAARWETFSMDGDGIGLDLVVAIVVLPTLKEVERSIGLELDVVAGLVASKVHSWHRSSGSRFHGLRRLLSLRRRGYAEHLADCLLDLTQGHIGEVTLGERELHISLVQPAVALVAHGFPIAHAQLETRGRR